MEKNNLTTRDKLKTYFETGKYPTQNQFSDLIDSLKHKGDNLSNKEAVIIANSLESIDNANIYYSGVNIGNEKFVAAIGSKDEEDQMITIREYRGDEKRYLFGSSPYTIKAKEFPVEGLEGTEYYYLSCNIGEAFTITKMFGNNLPAIPDGFEFGTGESRILYLRVFKQDFGQKVNIVNTNIKFVNATQAAIRYTVQSTYWGHQYTFKDIITDHYDAWDYLEFAYSADLREINQSIECKVYDTDKDALLMTASLHAGQNNQNIFGGDRVKGIRNIRIECNYAVIGK
ncbi:hypothetical protein [Chryseobacterium viscerum]|uniref:Uncharacterized protein n=1 Tax=Chryseobacterium viscerum TaxID=1037377 RepID=A0A5N4BSE7_9FLAO|nr:hypothetical protein [Chryseobacterium viscerum]KAB1231348.1 hypothetical protein F8D52_05950 [Chryseobacterium viscerum]